MRDKREIEGGGGLGQRPEGKSPLNKNYTPYIVVGVILLTLLALLIF
jgi:hypothetical protein